jgi:DedD protein
VMVGRGVDSTAGEVQAARPAQEDRLVAEESPAAQPSPPAAEDLTYPARLEGDKVDDPLTKGSSSKVAQAEPARPAATQPAKGKAQTAPDAKADAKTDVPKPDAAKPDAAKPDPAKGSHDAKADAVKPPRDAKATVPSSGAPSFTIQVGAFKDKASAESVVTRLKGKGFPAYVVSPEGTDGGLFNVRVGSYPVRGDAERIQGRLKDEEKFNPFIVKQ